MKLYNWSKRKALLVSCAVGLGVAVALLLLLLLVLVPVFEDRDTRTIVSLLGGLFVGHIAAQVGRGVYIDKAEL